MDEPLELITLIENITRRQAGPDQLAEASP
jgi:hypothetical protein